MAVAKLKTGGVCPVNMKIGKSRRESQCDTDISNANASS
jgi:hypothetical protein